MALDTRGVMDGAMQGFGLMDRYYSNQHRQAMDKENMAMRQEMLDRRRSEWERSDDERSMKAIHAELATTNQLSPDKIEEVGRIAQRNPELLPPQLREWHKNQAARTNEVLGLQGTVAATAATRDKNLQAKNKGITERQGQTLLEDIFSGAGISEESAEVLTEAPSGFFMMGTPEMDKALSEVDRQMEIVSAGGKVTVTPEFLETMNTVYANQIGEGKEIVGIFPGKKEGTIVFELEVDSEDGPYTAPLTVNRGTEGEEDNEIKQVPIEEVINSLQSAKVLNEEFKANPEAMQTIQRHGQMLGFLPQMEEPEKQESYETRVDAMGNTIRRNLITGKDELVVSGRSQPCGQGQEDTGSGKYRREQLNDFSKAYTKLITDPEMINFPEQQKQAIDALETHYAKTLGVPKKELIRLITYNAQGLVDDQTHRTIMNMHGSREVGLEEPEAPEQEGQPPLGITQPPPTTTKLGQQHIQDDLKNIDGLDGANRYAVRQIAKILQDDSEGVTGQGLRWMIDQGREKQEKQNQQRRETQSRPAQQRTAKMSNNEQVQTIMQQLQQLAPRINAGDPKAKQLAQQLSARLAEITSQ